MITLSTEAVVVVLLLFVVSLYEIVLGFKNYRTGQLVQNTPTEKVRSMAVGRTELAGTARDAGILLDEPFGDGKCLYYDYQVEERRIQPTKRRKRRWKTISSGRMAVPFYLDDGTGEVLVLANEGAEFSISDDNSFKKTYRRGQRPPSSFRTFDTTVEIPDQLQNNVNTSQSRGRSRIQTFIRNLRDKSNESMDLKLRKPDLGKTRRKRRYRQKVLPVGEDAYVFGSAEIRENPIGANEERLTIYEDNGTGRFVVSDAKEDVVATKFRRKGVFKIVFGVVVSTVCLYLLLTSVVFV